jgi:hypothetical protein
MTDADFEGAEELPVREANAPCSICGCDYAGAGHYAVPVWTGFCCDGCNVNVVLLHMHRVAYACLECFDEVN